MHKFQYYKSSKLDVYQSLLVSSLYCKHSNINTQYNSRSSIHQDTAFYVKLQDCHSKARGLQTFHYHQLINFIRNKMECCKQNLLKQVIVGFFIATVLLAAFVQAGKLQNLSFEKMLSNLIKIFSEVMNILKVWTTGIGI